MQRAAIRDGMSRHVGPVSLAAALSIVPFMWRAIAGVGHVPAGDAWAYERIFQTYHETGHVVFVGWNDITLVGMLPVTELWVTVVGNGTTQLHLLGSIVGFIALLGFRDFLTSVHVDRPLLPMFVLGSFVGFVGVAGTYLADLFSYVGVAWCLAFAARLIERPHVRRGVTPLAVAAGLSGAYGFSVRQQAVGAFAAVLFVLWRERRRLPSAWRIFAGTFAVVSVPMYLWRRSIPNGGSDVLTFHPRGALSAVVAMWLTLGLLALPLAVSLLSGRSRPRRAVVAVASAPLLVVLVGLAVSPLRPVTEGRSIVGDVFARRSPVAVSVGVVAAAAATWAWVVLVSHFSALRESERRKLALPLRLFVVVVGFDLAIASAGSAFFPRYALASGGILIAALAIRMKDASRPFPLTATAARVIAAGAGAALSVWALDQSAAPVHGIEAAAEVAACAGIPPDRLDAGFVWDGVHSTGIVDRESDAPVEDDGLPETIEQRTFPSMRRQAVLVQDVDDARGLPVIGPFRSSGLLPGSSVAVWLVTTPAFADGAMRCAESARRDGVEVFGK